jgi:hypothetical protein
MIIFLTFFTKGLKGKYSNNTNSKLVKIEKDEFTNKFTIPMLIVYNGKMPPTNMTKPTSIICKDYEI